VASGPPVPVTTSHAEPLEQLESVTVALMVVAHGTPAGVVAGTGLLAVRLATPEAMFPETVHVALSPG
jgi:hypothetical protein